MSKILITYLTFFLLTISWAYAQKTDTVTLYNGNKITCEVISLSKGRLSVKTSDMGTLSIKWGRIATLETLHKHEITLDDHSVYYGQFRKGEDGTAMIKFGVFNEPISLLRITSLAQINSKFWQRLTGYIDAGYSYTHGNKNLQFNSSGEVSSRSQKFSNKLEFSSIISDNSQNFSTNQNGGYTLQAFHKKSIFSIYSLAWDQNTELGIESRGSINARFGYSPVDNKVNILDISIGLLLNRELSSEQVATTNTEGIFSVNYDLFVFNKPNIDLSTSIIVYPSFTVKERLRSDFDFRVRWEVFNNFTLNFKYYYKYDSHPPSVEAIEFDYGINTSIGYTF